MAIEVPDLGLEEPSENPELENSTDDVIQQVYDATAEAIEEELGVEVEFPTRHHVVFNFDDASIEREYGYSGEERFWTGEPEAGNYLSEEEFVEKISEKALWKLKKAISIFSCTSQAQQMYVSQEILDARYG